MSDDKLDRAYALNSANDVKSLYRDWADSYDSAFAAAAEYRLPRLVAGAFLEMGGQGPLLDAGCGTGLVADALPEGLTVDGVDLSPDMLDTAQAKGRYRALVEADLTQPLPFDDGDYRGLLSAGTFTHGHVGPDALAELIRCLAPGGIAALFANAEFMAKTGFRDVLSGHATNGLITAPAYREERIYGNPDGAPDGHGDDMGYVITFHRL